MVCPVHGCIEMVELDSSTKKTWNELEGELSDPMKWEELREFQKKHDIEIH